MGQERVWFITGCSRGLGREVARLALQNGDCVLATARQPDQLKGLRQEGESRVRVLKLDLNIPGQAYAAVSAGVDAFGHIDVVVNNASYGLLGAIEEVSDQEIRDQMETNFFGALEVIRAVLPSMRSNRKGHIINISSGAGFVGSVGFGLYSASKFALEGLSEVLFAELRPLGVRVTIVEPGPTRTHWVEQSVVTSPRVIGDYSVSSGQTRQKMAQPTGWQPSDPSKVAAAIVALADAKHPPLRLALGQETVEQIRGKLATVAADLQAWESVSLSTDSP